MNELDDVVKEFLIESYENLDRLDQDFVALETDPTAKERLASIFRTIHTIKGTCGFLAFGKLEKVAHVGENLLSRLRDGELVIDSPMTTALLRLVDAIREILGSIEKGQVEGDTDYAALIDELKRLHEISPASASADANPPAEAVRRIAAKKPVVFVAPPPPADEPVLPANGPQAVAEVHHASSAADSHRAEPPVDASAREAVHEPGKEAASGSLANNAVRVDVGLLDKLMNLVGELVLARNQVLQFNSVQSDPAFHSTTQHLNLITTELQESVMKTRMQPIGGLWDKFPRVVRDLSQSCGKKVRIEMEGRETELDRTILEAIKDPLTHIIRNSVDHGVERPEVRVAAGKCEEGRLFMRAFHEGGQVIIEIADDGGGIDPQRVKKKALEKGLITPDQAARMADREAIALIFLPGFSTAEKITNVSGRGVGMDVVKTNVEKIGGAVDVSSRLGEGTVLKIKIPLTLAIIPALVVTAAKERFAIPQVSLLELVRIEGGESKVETIHGVPVYRLRGKLLPLIYLRKVLKLGSDGEEGFDAANESANIVVLRGGEGQFGLVVDQINDTEEIVVKPLGKQLKGVDVLAGATIMGDGRVALILDVMGLAHRANVVSKSAEEQVHGSVELAATVSSDMEMLLLCSVGNGRRTAIPLSQVARLEEFSPSVIEQAGPNQVVQYRGQIMPLIDVARAIGEQPLESENARTAGAEETIQVVVHVHEDRNIGLRVKDVKDIVLERVKVQCTGERPGVRGTLIIKEKVTELLDVRAVVESTVDLAAA
jgi:two-component system chemotaxis sensor kinase CheA